MKKCNILENIQCSYLHMSGSTTIYFWGWSGHHTQVRYYGLMRVATHGILDKQSLPKSGRGTVVYLGCKLRSNITHLHYILFRLWHLEDCTKPLVLRNCYHYKGDPPNPNWVENRRSTTLISRVLHDCSVSIRVCWFMTRSIVHDLAI